MAIHYTAGRFQAFDSNGDPLSGGKLYTYQAGTLTPQATYTTAALTTPNANPVVLDSQGRAPVWLALASYRMVLKTSADVTITDDDNIQALDAGEISYTPAGSGSVIRTIKSRLDETYSVKNFGATGDGTTDDTAAIQAAANAAAGVARLHFPAGEYSITDTLRVPSESYWFGDGKESIIKMADAVLRNKACIVTGLAADHRSDIVIENLTVDYNRERWTNGDGVGTDDTRQSAIAICNSSNVVLRHVRAIDAYKHCIDVTSPTYMEGEVLPTVYSNEPSYDVWLEGCYASGGGDDNITTHHSYNITIRDCVSEFPSGIRTNDNSNCYEIDDGSRNVLVTGCRALAGVCGIQIKGHNYGPAPYNITVSDFTTVNAIMGVEVRHTGYYGSIREVVDGGASSYTLGATPPAVADVEVTVGGVAKTPGTDYTLAGNVLTPTPAFTAGTGNVVITYPVASDGDSTGAENDAGETIVFTGSSPTARNVVLSNITIVAPLNRQETYSGPYEDGAVPEVGVTLLARGGLRIRSYENVVLSNIIVSDGTLDLAEDFEPYAGLEKLPVRFYGGARNVQVKNLSIYGFATGCGTGEYDGNPATNVLTPMSAGLISAVLVSSSFGGGLYIDGITIVGGPFQGVRATADAQNVVIDNYQIVGNHSATADSYPIRMTGATSGKRIGQGYSSGYVNAPLNLSPNSEVRKAAISSGGTTVAPQPMLDWVWQEGGQDLGIGEGGEWAMKARLVADTQDYKVASIRYSKTTDGDASRNSDLILGVSTDSGATLTDLLKLASSGHLVIGGTLANQTNDAGASGAGVPVGGIYRNGSVLMVRVS